MFEENKLKLIRHSIRKKYSNDDKADILVKALKRLLIFK